MGTNFHYLTVEERAALSPEDFGDPERRLFPVLTQEDINLAPRRISFFPNVEELKSRLISIAVRKGFSLPEVWATDVQPAGVGANVATASAFSVSEDGDYGVAEFELEASKDTNDGEYILRTGKIFEAGQYKDKKFEISPEELCEAIADFQPVDVDLEHMPTILDGKLGRLEAVALGADGWSLIGTVRLPKWLDSQLADTQRKVSATWDRVTKKLTKLALVRNPRVKDAALMAAFMANECSTEMKDVDIEKITAFMQKYIEDNAGEFAAQTWDGRSVIQNIHDMASRAGAVCHESEASYNEAKEAGFVSEKESKTIQQIHDASMKAGAKCSFIKERSGDSPSYYNLEEINKMKFAEIKKFFSGLPDDLELPENLETNSDDKKAAELSAKEEALKVAEAKLEAEKAAFEAQVKSSAEEAAKTKEEVAEPAAEEEKVVENSETSPSERELQLEAELAELRKKDVQRDAEKFADSEIKKERAFPAERETLIALFMQAATDDNSAEAKISFKSEDKTVEGSRVDALKALYAVRKPHNLTIEEVNELGGANVLLATYNEDEDYEKQAEEQAKEFAAKRNKAIKK